jgi:hypothetical protein
MHQQLIMNIIDLFTPQSKVDFYSKIFDTLDLSSSLTKLTQIIPDLMVFHAMHSLELLWL